MKSYLMILCLAVLLTGCKKAGDVIDTAFIAEMERTVATQIGRYYDVYMGIRPLEIPKGLVDATVLKQLGGENPKKQIFWVPEKKHLDAKGNLVDRWGHVYHLFVNPTTTSKGPGNYKLPNGNVVTVPYMIWSDGPNGKDEGGYGDDIRNWK